MEKFDEQDLRKAMAMANTPAGQQLLALLRQTGGTAMQQAMEKAAAGDLTQAREALSTFLNNPEAKKLLKQLGR